MFRVFEMALAAIVAHSDFVLANVPACAPLRQCPLFTTPGLVDELRAQLLADPRQKMTPTGVPPHTSLLRTMTTLAETVTSNFDTLPGVIASAVQGRLQKRRRCDVPSDSDDDSDSDSDSDDDERMVQSRQHLQRGTQRARVDLDESLLAAAIGTALANSNLATMVQALQVKLDAFTSPAASSAAADSPVSGTGLSAADKRTRARRANLSRVTHTRSLTRARRRLLLLRRSARRCRPALSSLAVILHSELRFSCGAAATPLTMCRRFGRSFPLISAATCMRASGSRTCVSS